MLTLFCTGSRLCKLASKLTGSAVSCKEGAKFKIQRVENIQKALDAFKNDGVHLENIGAPDINEGNVKLLMGLLWW